MWRANMETWMCLDQIEINGIQSQPELSGIYTCRHDIFSRYPFVCKMKVPGTQNLTLKWNGRSILRTCMTYRSSMTTFYCKVLLLKSLQCQTSSSNSYLAPLTMVKCFPYYFIFYLHQIKRLWLDFNPIVHGIIPRK